MKALIYKELKLALHPICIVFVLTFPFMILIPSYPIGVGFIYILSTYPILFLGANKGQQSNDLMYSVLLPVRKKDVVLARIITVILMQVAFIAVMTCLLPLARYLNELMANDAIAQGTEGPSVPGFGFNAFVSVLAFAIVGLALADLIFFPIYYKHGKSIVGSTLTTILGFTLFMTLFTIILPYAESLKWYSDFFAGNLINQFIALGISLVISAVIHIFVYKISSKELDIVDF